MSPDLISLSDEAKIEVDGNDQTNIDTGPNQQENGMLKPLPESSYQLNQSEEGYQSSDVANDDDMDDSSS